MSTPAPASTEWVPLWDLQGGVALEYRGAWAAGTYRDGDIVVDNGVAYMCVRPTTQRPTPWATPASPSELAYAESVADVVLGSTSTVIVTAPPVTCDGVTRLMVEFFAMSVQPPSNAGSFVVIDLFMDGASIGSLAFVYTPVAGLLSYPAYMARRLMPAAGVRTFSVRGSGANGNGLVDCGGGGGGGNMPAFIRVTRA